MSNRPIFKMSLILLSFCLLGIAAGQAAEEIAPDASKLTEQQEDGLIIAISKQRRELSEEEKDGFGAKTWRSKYSKLFKEQEDGSQKVTVMIDHAVDALLTTARHEWLFKPTNEKRSEWEFVEDTLVDSWQSLVRFNGQQTDYSFESFHFNTISFCNAVFDKVDAA